MIEKNLPILRLTSPQIPYAVTWIAPTQMLITIFLFTTIISSSLQIN